VGTLPQVCGRKKFVGPKNLWEKYPKFVGEKNLWDQKICGKNTPNLWEEYPSPGIRCRRICRVFSPVKLKYARVLRRVFHFAGKCGTEWFPENERNEQKNRENKTFIS